MVSSGDLDDAAGDDLSEVIEQVLDDEDVEEPVTLGAVRRVLTHSTDARSAPIRRLDENERTALVEELDVLIDLHGADAEAEPFTHPFAGPDLTRVLEHALERVGEPTLDRVRSMVEAGLIAELIGEGEVAEEDEQAIRASLDALIDRHGGNAFAEDFIGSS